MEVADTTPSGDDAHCKDGYKFHVLLVEDDEVTLCVVERLLKNCNYEVTVATNGRQALEVLERCTPDLILTDLAMPELSGLELVDGVIHNERFSSIPVVVMSSNDSFTAVKEAMEAGAQDFLIKPIRRNELTTLWRHVWRNNPQRVATQPAVCSRRPGHLSGIAAKASKQLTFASSNRPATKQSPSGPPITSHGPHSGDPLHNRAYVGNVDAVYAQHAGSASPAEASPLRMDASTDATTSCQPDVGGLGTSGQEEWEVPVAAEDGVVGGSQGSPVAEHVVPPAHQDMVDLNIKPLDLPPPLERAGGAKGLKEEKPSALQELAELGARRYDEQVKERNKVAAEHRYDERVDQDVAAQSGGSFGTLHHSANSAFTHFAALVPPPCSRGDWGAYHDCGAATSNHCNPRLHTVPEWPTAAGFNSSVPSMSVGAVSHQGSLQRQAAMTAAASQLHQQQLQQQQHLQQQQQMQQHQLQQHHHQQQQSLHAMHHPAALWMAPAMEMMQTQQQRFLQGLQEAIQQHREEIAIELSQLQAATRHMSADAKRHRLAAVEKFRQKRKQRTFEKKVRYESRKKLAEARPRIKGQFVKADVAQQYQALQEKGQAEAAYALLQQQA